MKVSIVIRAYNSEKTIKKAVNSALSQDFPKKELEVIVINDGSTDKTLKILKDYKKKIRLISQKNQGAIPAANRGFMAARGEYIILLDSDDFFKPTILKEMVAILDKNPNIDFVYCDYYEKSPRGNIKIISTKNIFNTIAGGIIFKRRKLAKEGFYNERIKFVEYDLLLKTQNKWKGCHISRPLFYYVRRKESIASNRKWLKKALAELKKLHPQKIKEIKKIRKY
ncbi:MAG: glycosyltransferase [Parcubacteria group bacterium]